MTDQRDTINPKSYRGVGPYGPSGPEAEIRSVKATADKNLKLCAGPHNSLKVSESGQTHMSFKTTDGVQVREEAFGLLFYNYRGPRLFFVPSGDLIGADFFEGRQNVGDLIESISRRKGWTGIDICKKITMILDKLAEKGLIYEQSIC